MRKTPSALCVALSVFCLLILSSLALHAQERDRDRDQDKDHENEHPSGIVQDWSHRHAVYPRFGPIQSLIDLQHDSRALLSWQDSMRNDWRRYNRHRFFHSANTGVHMDWSISLGLGTIAPAMYPAKFTFDIGAAPNCATDYVVFPVNVAGSATQPNIVAFHNLYSGTVPANGICNRALPPPGDNGTSATTFWSYDITAAGGVVSTSPALSMDGTKVAFVESGSGATHFHVLAWKSGDGVDVSTPNAQSVLKPVVITSGFATLAPAAASGTVTDLALGTSTDTLSSPYVDYAQDTAYVGNDGGILFRIKNVFCKSAACTVGVTGAPSLDSTWNGTGSVDTGCGGKLTGAVVAATGNVFVGCSDGKLYGFTVAGVPLGTPSLVVGNGSATGGIVDTPVVDMVNGLVYVVSGNSSGGTAVLVQASTVNLGSVVTATLGTGGAFNLHAPAFNEAYFSSGFTSVANIQGSTGGGTTSPGTTSNWQIYEWGVSGGLDALFGVGFNNAHTMTPGAASNFLQISGSTTAEFSPLTEILNGSTDQLLASGLTVASPNLIEYNLTDFAGLFPNVLFPLNSSSAVGASRTEGSGTSGIVVDNVSGSSQASSVYFGVLTSNTAVKLTQSGLN